MKLHSIHSLGKVYSEKHNEQGLRVRVRYVSPTRNVLKVKV